MTQRGHGDADRPASGYDLGRFASDVAEFLDAVGIGAAVIVGDSSGGYVAQRFAVDHPRRTRGLVLVSAVRSFRDIAGVERVAETVAGLRDPVDPEFVRGLLATQLFNPVPQPFLDAVVGESCKVPARVWGAVLQGLLEADPPTAAGRITAPATILWGDRDEYCPRSEQEALAAGIADSSLVTYEDTGHAVIWERPERVAADVVALTAAL